MGRACGTYGERGKVHKGYGGNPEVKKTTWKT
jgi:hypothetical protein